MDLTTDRRQLLLSLLSVGTLPGLQGFSVRSELEAITKEILNFPNLDLPSKDSISFDVFFRLCQLITAQIDLENHVAEKIYELNQKEPWGIFHASSVYQKIISNFQQTKQIETLPQMVENNKFRDGEEWYLSHLLTTWMLGIYYHESAPAPVRVSFDLPLMRSAVAGILPVPGSSDLGERYWENKPSVYSRDL